VATSSPEPRALIVTAAGRDLIGSGPLVELGHDSRIPCDHQLDMPA